jgi:hypothetical protein
VKLSLILTINNRMPEVSRQVANSFLLPGNEVDEAVIVLDRPTPEARAGATEAYQGLPGTLRFVEVEGPPGWRGPARAWNAGFKAATGDLFYCISSEVVQDAGNVDKARALCADGKTVAFGACHNSTPVNLVVGAEPGLLVSSKMPRPLGFIVCMPAKNVCDIAGFDEAFMGTPDAPNYWYDDDDFMLRLWRSGLNFVFDDAIHGTHLHHERPDLATPEGQAGIQRNAAYMLKKHGTMMPWTNLPRMTSYAPGRLTWSHL